MDQFSQCSRSLSEWTKKTKKRWGVLLQPPRARLTCPAHLLTAHLTCSHAASPASRSPSPLLPLTSPVPLTSPAPARPRSPSPAASHPHLLTLTLRSPSPTASRPHLLPLASPAHAPLTYPCSPSPAATSWVLACTPSCSCSSALGCARVSWPDFVRVHVGCVGWPACARVGSCGLVCLRSRSRWLMCAGLPSFGLVLAYVGRLALVCARVRWPPSFALACARASRS